MTGKPGSQKDEPKSTRLRWLLGTAGVLTIPLLLIWWPGCREYPPVTSPEALTLIKLLYTACNTKDEARLTEVERRVERAVSEGHMTPAEQEAFAKVIAQARGGDWDRATDAALKFAQDQVGQGTKTPRRKARHSHDGHIH